MGKTFKTLPHWFFLFTILLFIHSSQVLAQALNISSFNPDTVCQGEKVVISGTGFTDATDVKLGTKPASSFKIKDDKTIEAIVDDQASSGSVIVTTKNNGADTMPGLNIKPAPIPVLQDKSTTGDPFTNCMDNATYQLIVQNNSSNVATYSVYDIDWGDGSTHFTQTDWLAGQQTPHTYNDQGYFKITMQITPTNGCTKKVIYDFYNGANPLASLTTTTSTTGLCVPASISFVIGNWFNNSAGTTYSLDFGDGTIKTLNHPLNSTNTDEIVPHTYTTSSCPQPYYQAILKAKNACLTTTYTLDQIVIRQKPKVDYSYDKSAACINEPVCFTNHTIDGSSGVSTCYTNADFLWNFGDGSTSTLRDPGCHVYAKAGTYVVKLSASNTACGSDEITKTITVKPTSPIPSVPVTTVKYCQNDPSAPLIATGTGLLWYTTLTGGVGNPTAPMPSTNIPGVTTYYVSQTISGQCESPRVAITVTVNAKPNPPSVTTPVTLCKGVPATPLTATGTGLLWYTTSTGGTGSVTAPTPSTSSVGTTYYYVSQTTNNCEGPRATIEVTVMDKPAAPIVVTPVNYCQNQAAQPLQATGSKLLWYTTASGGIGSAVTPIPSTATLGTTSYYVSQSNYCGESPRAVITVNVFAGPSATITYTPSSLCNSSTALSVPVTITGDKTGSFSISPSGLPINSSTGTLNPANALAGAYKITYTINASGGCSVFTTQTTVTVSSMPFATINYPAICSSTPSISPVIAGTEGGGFSSDAGLTIDKTTGVISPATSTVGTHTVKYSIAPSPPCSGFDTNTTVTITQAPSATIQYIPSSLCNTANSPAVDVAFTGDNGGIFTISPSTGLNTDATGKLSPAGATPGTYTITYTINASGGCAIFQAKDTVTVSSTPTASIQYPPICSLDGNTKVTLTGTQGGSFSTSSPDLIIDKTTGTISPLASKAGTYTVKYSIAPSPPCPGFDTSTTVIITQAPSASISYPADLCNVNDTTNPPVTVSLTGDIGGSFSIQPSMGLTLNTSSGEITPAGAIAEIYTIIYTLKGTGGCKDFADSATVVIHSTPMAKIEYQGSPFCGANSSLVSVILTGNKGGIFTSLPTGLSLDAATGAINASLSKPGIYTVTYTITPSPPCPGFITDTKVEIAESPDISFDVTSQAVCSGQPAIFKPASTVLNTVYNWNVVGTLPPGVSGKTSGTVSDPNASINLLFTNKSTVSETITIKVVPVNPTSNPCNGAPYNLTLTINPIPATMQNDTTRFCMHDAPTVLIANPDAGNVVKWYDANNAVLGHAPVINTANPATFLYYATQTNSYGCESGKATFAAIVNPVAKIVSTSYTNPTSCGLPTGSITLNILDLNNNPLTNIPVIVYYTKFQTAYTKKDTADASGKIVIDLTAGTYSDIFVETYSCTSQKIPDVFVLKDPSPPAQPVAGYNGPICSETIINLSASSPTSSQPGPINYVWVGPAFGSTADTTQKTVVSFPSANTSYNGTYIVYAMQNNCISTPASFQVVIKQAPVKPTIVTRTPLCIGDNLSLQAYSSVPGNSTLNYTWNGPGSGFPVNNAIAGINNVQIKDGGVYTVSVTSPETGCTVTADTMIQIGGYPIVKFSQDSLNLPTGHKFNLSPTILNAGDPNILPIQKFTWTPAQNIECNDAACSSPLVTVKTNICYTVKATNVYGCSGSTAICINTFCTNAQVFIPNAFTPHGLAENSKFIVRASGIASIKSFRVFNRWGRVVFEKNNFAPNDAAYGWDGTIAGKPADMGVYVYTVQVICENGTPYFYKGNVTLIK